MGIADFVLWTANFTVSQLFPILTDAVCCTTAMPIGSSTI